MTKLAELTPDKRNANKGTHRGRKMIAESLRDYGAGRSILIDRNGNIIAGNKTAEGARAVGIDEVQIVESDGTKLIAVKRTDLDIDSAEARALAIADNRASEVSLDWDLDILKGLETEVKIDQFWSHVEFDALVGRESTIDAPEPQIDKAAGLQEKWGTERGQIWQIGEHRLMCGDSTSEDVKELMAGERAKLMATDPPYLVDYHGGNHPLSLSNNEIVKDKHSADYQEAKGDDFFERYIAAAFASALDDNAAIYQWHAHKRQALVEASWLKCGLLVHQQIIWVKARAVLTHSHFMWKHEPCFYGWKQGHQPKQRPANNSTTVWEIDSKGFEGTHPTEKPLDLFANPMRWHLDQAGLCYEPFSGSGTSLCAAQATGRRCFAMEIAPAFVAVALERLSAMGLAPKLATSGAVAQQTAAPEPLPAAPRTKRPRAPRIAATA